MNINITVWPGLTDNYFIFALPDFQLSGRKGNLGSISKKKNCEISDICQISVTLPTLYPDMDIKKFGHIFYTLTYLPIKKIWTNLEKSWYSYKAFRLFENLNI